MNQPPFICPKGFQFNGMHAGLKKNEQDLDLTLIAADEPCQSAGVFTQNHLPGEPVKLCRSRLKQGLLQALIVNSYISNVATGQEGYDRAVHICNTLSNELNINESLTTMCSTGIIGRQIPESKIENSIPELVQKLGVSEDHFIRAAKGIMTTDTVHKARWFTNGQFTITIIAKGAGMIAPNMATMLAFICTDAKVDKSLKGILKRVVAKSFNCISVDFDTSTSDSCILMSSGKAGLVDADIFENHLQELCLETAKDLVKDGEGVDKVIRCHVRGGKSESMVQAVASSIINSPLVKTMVTGADPNWGRVIMAIGKVHQESDLNGVKPSIEICSVPVYTNGKPIEHNCDDLSNKMKNSQEVSIEVDLHLGKHNTTHFGANLSKEYVEINAEYTT